ncbi:MAG: sugar phosphate isomerase/epimerase [Anaerolineae bacterium]|nr:sugar phosphate isomerase/epimerase [Anaerolineae bacterium]
MTKAFRVGHTGITWGYDLSTVEQAVKEVAELGYAAFETFGWIIEPYEQQTPGGFQGLLDKYGLPLGSAYCNTYFVDPSQSTDDIEQVLRWARLAKRLGAQTIVLQAAGQRPPEGYDFPALAKVFSEIGRRVQEIGLIAAIHPHTGTLIETRAEIDAVLSAVEPQAVFFAPDTGQITKGGSDILEVLDTYSSLVRHVHLKDYIGGPVERDDAGEEIDPTGYVGYTPIGHGSLPMPAIFRFLEEIGFSDLVMVELDYTPRSPRPAREAAAMSKRYLQEQLDQVFEAR